MERNPGIEPIWEPAPVRSTSTGVVELPAVREGLPRVISESPPLKPQHHARLWESRAQVCLDPALTSSTTPGMVTKPGVYLVEGSVVDSKSCS